MSVFNIVYYWENILNDSDHIVQTETVLHTYLKFIVYVLNHLLLKKSAFHFQKLLLTWGFSINNAY